MHGNTIDQMQHGQRYLLKSKQIIRLLDEMFRVSFPEFYKKHKKAFEAGKWFADAPGPWLGMAVVYKLQTEIHLDETDAVAPVAIFCCGQFTEGYLELPDLNMRFL